jgi:hypothetical protein
MFSIDQSMVHEVNCNQLATAFGLANRILKSIYVHVRQSSSIIICSNNFNISNKINRTHVLLIFY